MRAIYAVAELLVSRGGHWSCVTGAYHCPSKSEHNGTRSLQPSVWCRDMDVTFPARHARI